MRITVGVLLFLLVQAIRADQIAFFYALDNDYRALAERGNSLGQAVRVGSRSLQRIRLGPHTICAVKMGSGSIETAVSAQALLARFRCDHVYSIGPAGALRPELKVGDWHEVQMITGWQRGSMDSTGMKLSPDAQISLPSTRSENRPQLLTSSNLIHIASGEIFLASAAEGARIRELTGADAIDMNLYGLAVVCQDHHVPLTAWKIISDHADEQASDDFRTFLASYEGAGGAQLAELILALPPQPNDPLTYPAIEKALRAE